MKEELKNKVDKWFTKNWKHYTSEVSKNIANGKMNEYSNDLCLTCYEAFMNRKEEDIEQMERDNKILHFLLSCCSFQIRSGTSPFYSQHRKHRMRSIPEYFGEQVWSQHDEINLDDYYKCAMEVLNSDVLNFYEKKLINLKFIEEKTFKEIFEEYDFPQLTTRRHLYGALEKIEKYCNQKLEG